VRVVVDHVAGTRRGQRQEFPAESRVRFGRHPDCEVSFDAHRDIDASSRHAELRPRVPRVTDVGVGAQSATTPAGAGWVLVDLGSSNGTYVDGHRITEASITESHAVAVDFGPGGPRIRLFIGDDAAIASLPPPPIVRTPRPWLVPAIGTALALILLVLLIRC
jgi:pSer/pThr/pTyr-binding forkhead associated (FHA) protein